MLAATATVYGVVAALSVLLQARQMLASRRSCHVSVSFLATYAGGYGIWLLYGLSVGNVPIIVVDALGLVCGAVTLAVALSLRAALARSLGPVRLSQLSTGTPLLARSAALRSRSASSASPRSSWISAIASRTSAWWRSGVVNVSAASS
jgi:uncharacterized protein with PQ loop repeat